MKREKSVSKSPGKKEHNTRDERCAASKEGTNMQKRLRETQKIPVKSRSTVEGRERKRAKTRQKCAFKIHRKKMSRKERVEVKHRLSPLSNLDHCGDELNLKKFFIQKKTARV
jgi:hypothetical protein